MAIKKYFLLKKFWMEKDVYLNMRSIQYFFILLMFMSCSSSEGVTDEVLMRVNSYTVPCTGEAEGECLLIQKGEAIGTEDWEYFYFKDDIEGFDYEEGYVYDLLVSTSTVKDPPMDGSSIIYRLVSIKSKEKQQE